MNFSLVTSGHEFEESVPLLMHALGRFSTLSGWQQRYLTHPDFSLWLCRNAIAVIGIVGLRRVSPREMELTHIAVHPSMRRQGVGHHLIAQAMTRYPDIPHWWCTTDDEAVNFYRALGWRTTLQGVLHPGWQPRYRCDWTLQP